MCLVLPHSCVFCFLFNCYDGRDLNLKTSVIIIAQVSLNSSRLCKFDCYFLILSVVSPLLYKIITYACDAWEYI